MTRKEQIEIAMIEKRHLWRAFGVDDEGFPLETPDEFYHTAFITGAQWADANPDFLWQTERDDAEKNKLKAHVLLLQDRIQYLKDVLKFYGEVSYYLPTKTFTGSDKQWSHVPGLIETDKGQKARKALEGWK